MYYDVLINYCGLDPAIPLWSCKSHVRTYNEIKYSFSKQIKSYEYFIYVRKVFRYNQSEVKTSFKLIDLLSYTFAHFPKVCDYKNKYYNQKFNFLVNEGIK